MVDRRVARRKSRLIKDSRCPICGHKLIDCLCDVEAMESSINFASRVQVRQRALEPKVRRLAIRRRCDRAVRDKLLAATTTVAEEAAVVVDDEATEYNDGYTPGRSDEAIWAEALGVIGHA